MSIIASGISYRHTNNQPLFEHVALSVPDGAKVSLIGPNGAGKSTLLQLLAGRLTPATGSIVTSSHPYFIPQQTVPDGRNVAGLLGAADKLRALRAIYAGSVDPADFETLDDDWTIEERCRAALDEWGLRRVGPDTPAPLNAAYGDGSVGYHLREGVHFLSRQDWLRYMAFVKRHLAAEDGLNVGRGKE